MFLLVDLFAGLVLLFRQFGPFLFREFAVCFHTCFVLLDLSFLRGNLPALYALIDLLCWFTSRLWIPGSSLDAANAGEL